MFQRGFVVVLIGVLGSTVALSDIAAPAEVGVEKAVQALQQIVARQITSEAQAVKILGAEGAILFGAWYSLRNQGLSGGLGSVNYPELALQLKRAGISGSDFITHVKELSSLRRMVSMNDLVTVNSAVPKPRQTDYLAILNRFAPQQLEKYRFPDSDLARKRQSVIARLLGAAEAGAKLCANQARCLSDNIGTVVELDRLGLTDRGLSVNFAEAAFLGFPNENTRYVGHRLHPISKNFRMALTGVESPDDIESADVRSCILNGTPSMN